MTDCAVSLGGVRTVFCSASPNQTLAFSILCTLPEDPEKRIREYGHLLTVTDGKSFKNRHLDVRADFFIYLFIDF